MSGDWHKDPRIKEMDQQKIAFLEELSEQIRKTPKSRMMNRFLSMTAEAGRKGIVFSDRETDLLAGILTEYMDPEDRGRVEMFRMLSRKMAGRQMPR